MKSYDVIIAGAGIIGLSLAWELRKSGADVLVVERGQPGREATHASAGLLAVDGDTPAALREIASASLAMYPDFVHQLEADADTPVDFRSQGTLFLGECTTPAHALPPNEIRALEPCLADSLSPVFLLPEASVDPRRLVHASLQAAKRHGVHVVSGSPVQTIEVGGNGVTGIVTDRSKYNAPTVINCCGAWSSQLATKPSQLVSQLVTNDAQIFLPVRPVKGQMLAIIPPRKNVISHAIRSHNVYIVPRSDGRIVIGATVEEAGFDTNVDPDTILRLHQLAANLVPELGEGLIHESWAGLRPGSPDNLPIMGRTSIGGYFVATGHFRNGILLAPITARVMTQVVLGQEAEFALAAFSPQRFGTASQRIA